MPIAIMAFSYGKISYTLWIGMKLDSQEMGELNWYSCPIRLFAPDILT